MEQALSLANGVYQLARSHLDAATVRDGGKRIPEDTATYILAEGAVALRALKEIQRNVNVHRQQRLQAIIINLTAQLTRVENAAYFTGAGLQPNRVKWVETESAFASRIQTGVIVNVGILDVNAFLAQTQPVFMSEMEHTLQQHNAVKVNAVLVCEFSILHGDVPDTKTFNTKNAPIWQTTDLNSWFQDHIKEPLLRELDDFQEKDSGWTLQAVLHLIINTNKYNPIRGSGHIEIPEPIKCRKACINVDCPPEQCFKWAVLSGLYPTKDNAHRYQKYKEHENQVKFTGLDFPLIPRDVPKFERLNEDISVNVFILEKRKRIYNVLPYYINPTEKPRHVDLLLIQNYYVDEEGEDYDDEDEPTEPIRYHYVWIKNMSALIGKQVAKGNGRKYVCKRCLHYFWSEAKLTKHKIDCNNINKCRPKMPEQWNKDIVFQNFKHKEKIPFIIYADTECLLKPIETQQQQQCNTTTVQQHEPFSMAYYLSCSYDASLSGFHSYRGTHPASWFADHLLVIAAWVQEIYDNPLRMQPLTVEEQQKFRDPAAYCHICEKPLPPQLSERARDHCHLTGKYRGPVHLDCNINYQDSRTVPIVFHNLSNYDAHFLIRDIATKIPGRTTVIPQTMERYVTIIKHLDGLDIHFRFIDSYHFLASSLDKLSSYLPTTPITRQQFLDLSDEDFKLLTRKGVFPYEYMTSWAKLEERSLPTIQQFFSTLTGSDISDEDYQHAQNVWSTFNIPTLGDYADLYLKTDVLLLADVFENFRDNCLSAYSLDPAHYFTSPGLSWDAMLKSTGVKLELLTDVDQLLFVERGIRGGVSQCSNRYAFANNRYMPDYDSQKPDQYLMYFDVNNLYGWAMTQYLPYGGFEWADVRTSWNVPDDSPIGYILEVDLTYPEHLHDRHQDLPFCPESKAPPGLKEPRLLTTLYGKERYIIHYRNLRQAIKHGLVLTRIHRILQFNQSPWLKKYIDLNTSFRKNAKNEFEKSLFKLLNNSVFGKTMECVRNRVDVKLVTHWEGRYGAEAYVARPNFHTRAIFDENLVAIQLRKLEVLMNKPVYVGFCILDLSKTRLYEFHYETMPQILDPKCMKLLYTDTDSLIYEIQCYDWYQLMKENVQYFDTSDYPPDNPFGMALVNKKVIGLMKDECNGEILTEFVGLRSKMYSVRVNGQDRMKKCKGIKASVVKNSISFSDYVQCLKDKSMQTRTQYSFRSRLHDVVTVRQTKLALSPHDKKRYLLDNSNDTLPWGHYKIHPLDYLVAFMN